MILIFMIVILCIFILGWVIGDLITGVIFPNDDTYKHKICWLISGIIGIFILWFVASYIEIVGKNLGENSQYSFWNLINLLITKFN